MSDINFDEQLRLLQQQTALTDEALQNLQLDVRAAIDALRLEVDVLWRCLHLLHPDMADNFAAVRAEVIHTTDPEAS